MTQITRKSVPMRGLILLLAMFLSAGLVLSGCGDDDTATTPAPAPPPPPPPAPEPEPEPEPEPPAPEAPPAPTGLHADVTENSITWHWNAVEGALGYAVQVSQDEMFDATDAITPTAENHFTVPNLPPSTTLYGRVASAGGTLEAPILSDWTTHVTGMTPAPGAPVPPPAPSGLRMSAATDTSITWSWDAVMEADGYHVQFSAEENFDGVDPVATTETSHTQMGLSEGMTGYLRVRSTMGDLSSMWTAHLTAMTRVRPVAPSNLTATAGEGSITWTWDAVDNADSYVVQYSADGAFTDGGESMEVMDTSYTKDGLGTGDTAYLRVRASGGTDDQERLLSGWSDPLRGMSATPMVPAVPANLTAEGGEGSITWTWDMVEGATGYQVQVSMSEDFSGAETMDVDGTSHTAEVAAGTTAYLRVRATGMGDPSAWSTHVTGMSDAAPVPPPPAPDPVMVTFSLSDDAKNGDYLIADPDEDDREKAMASVNTEIMVESNTAAIITPEFIDDAAAVAVAAGAGNMPFTYVDWDLLQSEVLLGDGAVFKIQRTAMGANQMMEPTGDVAYVTCGPFKCSESAAEIPDRPEISIADSDACTMWEASVELDKGLVDNDVLDSAAGDPDDTANDGIDLGWLATSNQPMVVTHKFDGIQGGTNGSFKSEMKKKGEDVALEMSAFPAGVTNPGIAADVTADSTATPPIEAVVACVPAAGETGDSTQGGHAYSAASRDGIYKPDNCFRLEGKGANGKATAKTKGPDWLSGYTLEMAATGVGVSWGSVDWGDDDPFDDTCPVKTVTVADELNVCDLFKEEVAQATEGDWTFTVTWDATHRPVRWELTNSDASRARFSTLWFDDDLDGAIKNKNPDRPEPTAGTAAAELHDLYDNNTADNNLEAVWQLMTNTDGTPNRGDFGKVDLLSDSDDTTTTDVNESTAPGNPDGNADNYDASTRGFRNARKCDDADGEGCDAKWSDTFTIKFADGTFGCEDSVDVKVECEWDAQGMIGRGRGAADEGFDSADAADRGRYYKCTAK